MSKCLNCDLPFPFCVEFCSASCEEEWMNVNKTKCAGCGNITYSPGFIGDKMVCRVCVNKPWMLDRIPEGGC